MSSQSVSPKTAASLFSFLDRSPTPYHAVREVTARLDSAGFVEYPKDRRWNLPADPKGFTRFGDGAVVAFRGADPTRGVTILAAHTDSPALRVKERGVAWKKGYLVAPTEIYGGPIVSTWLDRELGMAGRAVTRDGNVHLVNLSHLVVVPNVAIHLNRKVNEGFAYNAQDHLIGLLALSPGASDENATDRLAGLVGESIGVDSGDLAEFEILLHDASPAKLCGIDGAMYTSGRVDNLAGCFTVLEAFLRTSSEKPAMIVLYNHEEVGSQTGEGAHSTMIEQVLRRLVVSRGGDEEDLSIAMAKSTVVSNDAAHALHPGHSEKYDSDYAPVLGGGPVLKINGMYRYATTASSGAAFAAACERAGVPMQRLASRSDARSGSTVGPATWTKTGMQTVDVGLPLLAMHSIRETGATNDVEAMIAALSRFIEPA